MAGVNNNSSRLVFTKQLDYSLNRALGHIGNVGTHIGQRLRSSSPAQVHAGNGRVVVTRPVQRIVVRIVRYAFNGPLTCIQHINKNDYNYKNTVKK